MKELEILEEVASTPAKSKKINILKENKDNTRLASLLDASLNTKRKYFIKKFDMPSAARSSVDVHDDFLNLLNNLENRSITGHDAKDAVEEMFSKCDETQQLWYKRVLLKDLKAKFTASTANKAGFDIHKFDCMLAKADKDCKKLEAMLTAGGWSSPKFDGYRCVAEIVHGHCTLYSRAGTPYENFPSVVAELERLFPTGKHMLDGEIMSDSFMAMQSSAFVKNKETVGDMIFHVFDMVPWDEWDSKKFTTRAGERYVKLEDFFKNTEHDKCIEVVKHIWVDSEEKIIELRDKYIDMGFEGVMFLPNVPYYLGKKSNKMLKFKEMKSMDVEIIGCYEGEKGKELEGSLGGFTVKQEDDLECRVGSLRGISREDRQRIWDNQGDFIGKVFEAEYQEIGSKGKMRFPVFIRWRDDKTT